MYSVVPISTVQPVTQLCTYNIGIVFYILFYYGLSQGTEYSSLCYALGACCLSTLYVKVHICLSQTQSLLSSRPLPLSNHRSALPVSVSVL